MGDLAIRTQRLSKSYRITQTQRVKYQTLRDQLAQAIAKPFQVLRNRLNDSSENGTLSSNHKNGSGRASGDGAETFWALKDVNIEIKQGELVGLIGRNGAGKSTLLKLLTHITEPTSGSIDIYGRVGSLLEVGTGFHQELSGRENIYLNGAVLGMRRAEINRKFDEIVAFSEVEKFIDTPVKFYSSGMTVRLAFAVAAHMEPEVLLVDEVLAVGDASFQKKCLAKMEDVGKNGRTIIFVSHHMPSITRLCERAILLDRGKVIRTGPTHSVVADHLNSSLNTSAIQQWHDIPERAPGNTIVRLLSARVKDRAGNTGYTYHTRQDVGIEMEYEVLTPGYVLYPYFTMHNEENVWLFTSIDTRPDWRGKPRPAGLYCSTAWIPRDLLAEGTMLIGPAMRTEEPFINHFYERECIAFQVVESEDKDSARIDYSGQLHGVVRPKLDWETESRVHAL